ncbi:hypothetical protein ACRBEV_04310 [Methylobacterium phyllosphaerae]
MSKLGLQLPSRVRHLNHECIMVEDATGTRAHYVYVDIDDTRRRSRNSVRPEQGLEIARLVARALTIEMERRGAGVARDPADLLHAVDAATEATPA